MKKALVMLLLLVSCLAVDAQKSKTAAQRKPAATAKQTAKKQTSAARQTSRKAAATSKKKQAASRTKGKTKATKGKRQQTAAKKQQPTVSGLRAQKERVVRERTANVKRKAELERNVKRGLENLMTLDTEIARQRKLIDTIRSNISTLSGHITMLDSQLVTLGHELDERRNRYMQSMRYMHRNRSIQNQLMFIFSADNFNQMYRRLRFSREYASYQRAQGEAVKSKQEQVTRKKEELSAAKKQKNQLLSRGEQEKRTLEGKQNEQQVQVDQLKKQQKTVQKLIEKQQREEAELNARIDKLIAEEIAREKARREAEARKKAAAEAARKRAEELARKKAAAEAARKESERRIAEAKAREEKAKAEARAASREAKAAARKKAEEAEAARKAAERRAHEEEVARRQEIDQARKAEEDYSVPAADRKLSGSFEANKGRLPLPITGAYKLVRGFGAYTPEGTRVQLQSNGWHLKGQSGSRAQCIFDGEVSGIYYQGGSYIVTVRHGKYISAYINLASVSVRKGQQVSARQVLGTLGGDNTMQFQLRNWTSLLNPSRWLGR